ncbi:MAG: VPLPA-CTERM sorting domain-containing protein [Desulfobacteraceae bacterium]|jgi:hypothetical protein
MKKTILLSILGIIFFFSNTANAAILFLDDFNSENGGNGALNYTGFANWDVTDGSVDLIGIGTIYDFYPGNGLYIDLDGSTRDAGRMETKNAFILNPGRYEFQFDLGGQTSLGANTVEIAIGSLYTESFTFTQDTATFITYSRFFDVAAATTATIIFDNSGGDNQGVILDNVQLSSVPVPAAVWLLGSGLLGTFVFRRRFR